MTIYSQPNDDFQVKSLPPSGAGPTLRGCFADDFPGAGAAGPLSRFG